MHRWLNRWGHVVVPSLLILTGLSMTVAGVYLWLYGAQVHTATLGVILFRIIVAPLGVALIALTIAAAIRQTRYRRRRFRKR